MEDLDRSEAIRERQSTKQSFLCTLVLLTVILNILQNLMFHEILQDFFAKSHES